MPARVLTYELGSPSLWRFKAQKLENDEEDDRLAIFKPSLW